MTKFSKNVAIVILLIAVSIVFLCFVLLHEGNDIYESRQGFSRAEILEIEPVKAENKTAPLGYVLEYRTKLDDRLQENHVLYFVNHHSDAEIYIHNELAYKISPHSDNLMVETDGSYEVTIPLSKEDRGKELFIKLTPFYSSAKINPEIYIGTALDIFLSNFINEIPMFFMCILSILLGLYILMTNLVYAIKKNKVRSEMALMGIVAICIGISNFTDLKTCLVLFGDKASLLCFVAYCSMPIELAAFLAAIRFSYGPKGRKLIFINELVVVVVSLSLIILDAVNLIQFRAFLSLIHVVLVAALSSVILFTINNRLKHIEFMDRTVMRDLAILMIGVTIDVLGFYSGALKIGMVFTMLAFDIFVALRFIRAISELKKRANIDTLTNLTNRNILKEQLLLNSQDRQNTAVIMIDLNGLKKVNDTMGHAAGDKMLVDFANILSDTFPRSSTICRWGGDEFVIVIPNTIREKVDNYIKIAKEDVEKYNKTEKAAPISFAVGYAMAEEFSDLTKAELVNEADKRMYRDKKEYYKRKNVCG